MFTCIDVVAYTRRVDMTRFREMFKRLRDERGLTQGGLASLTSDDTGGLVLGSQAISDIETGATKDPGVQTITRLIEVMQMPVSAFFALIEQTPREGLQSGDHSAEDASFAPVEGHHVDESSPILTPDVRQAFAVVFRVMQQAQAQGASGPAPAAGSARPPRPRPNSRRKKSKTGTARARTVGRVPHK